MKKWIGIVCLLALAASLWGCSEDTQKPTIGGIGTMFDAVNTHHSEKVETTGTVKLTDAQTENAEVFLPNALIADNMVLQRNAVNCIWGETSADGEVAVCLNGQTFYGTAEGGSFRVYLAPMEAGGPFELVIFNGTQKKTVKNVLIGEVFLLAGQSNMQMRVLETLPSEEEQQTYANDWIRLFEIRPDNDSVPQSTLDTGDVISWAASGPETTPYYSAAGYYFAEELQKKCPGLPIGLVMCCQGATYISTWMSENAVATLGCRIPDDANDPRLHASQHYNAMVHPILNYRFKAVLWYQGENQPQNYDKALTQLMSTWRAEFDNPSMAFVVFTLPRLVVDKYANYATVDESAWFESRRLQMLAVQNTENAVYCVANDLGSYDDIHPTDKKLIAQRACHAFLAGIYGVEETLTGPKMESYEVNGSTIDIRFANVGSGLELRNLNLGFEIFSENYEFLPASVELVGSDTVRITSSAAEPMGFRYAMTNVYPSMTEEQKRDMKNAVCLYNKEGYPAEQIQVVFAFP